MSKLRFRGNFHKWIGEIVKECHVRQKFEFASGTPLTEKTLKRNLCRTFLGVEAVESIDLVSGDISYTEEVKHTEDLTDPEYYKFLVEVDKWATDLNIKLTRGGASEYEQYKENNDK